MAENEGNHKVYASETVREKLGPITDRVSVWAGKNIVLVAPSDILPEPGKEKENIEATIEKLQDLLKNIPDIPPQLTTIYALNKTIAETAIEGDGCYFDPTDKEYIKRKAYVIFHYMTLDELVETFGSENILNALHDALGDDKRISDIDTLRDSLSDDGILDFNFFYPEVSTAFDEALLNKEMTLGTIFETALNCDDKDSHHDTAIILTPPLNDTKYELAAKLADIPVSELKNVPGTDREWHAFFACMKRGTQKPKTSVLNFHWKNLKHMTLARQKALNHRR